MNAIDTDLRFNKPAARSVIDLINKTLATQFLYDELALSNMQVLDVAPSADPRAPNTTIDVSEPVEDGEPIGPVATLMYHRLHLGDYLLPRHRYFPIDDAVPTPEEALAYLGSAHYIQIGALECEVSVESSANADGSVTVVVTPLSSSLVWRGSTELFGVDDDHLALGFPQVVLPGLTLADVQV